MSEYNHWDEIPPLRGFVIPSRPWDFDSEEAGAAQLKAENERLRELAAKYWVLRDVINWQIKAGKRVPKVIRTIFEEQMAEIDRAIA